MNYESGFEEFITSIRLTGGLNKFKCSNSKIQNLHWSHDVAGKMF